jgi:hypothetical protein
MIRGVKLYLPNEYGKFISEVLEPIDCNSYTWNLGWNEIYGIKDDKFTSEDLFKESIIDGKEFSDLINNNTYYTIFLEAMAFPRNKTITKINSYEDFLDSECAVVVLVADTVYADIYCKDQSLSVEISENAKEKGYENIRFIDENDSRTGFHI